MRNSRRLFTSGAPCGSVRKHAFWSGTVELILTSAAYQTGVRSRYLLPLLLQTFFSCSLSVPGQLLKHSLLSLLFTLPVLLFQFFFLLTL